MAALRTRPVHVGREVHAVAHRHAHVALQHERIARLHVMRVTVTGRQTGRERDVDGFARCRRWFHACPPRYRRRLAAPAVAFSHASRKRLRVAGARTSISSP